MMEASGGGQVSRGAAGGGGSRLSPQPGAWGSAPPLGTSEGPPGPASGHLGTRVRGGAPSGTPAVGAGGHLCACARRWATGEPPGLPPGPQSPAAPRWVPAPAPASL